MVARSRRPIRNADIWPGFVDALSSLLLVLIFLLVVFVLSEFFLGRALSGRNQALDQLNLQVSELAELLSLEQQANVQLRGDVNQLAVQLQTSTARRDALANQLAMLQGEKDALRKRLEEAGVDVASIATDRETLELQLAAAMEMLEAERASLRDERERQARARTHLDEQRDLSTIAQRQVAMLNQQIAALRRQLASVQRALDVRESEIDSQQVRIADLGRKLNVALASKVEELSRYRSEFFGRLRQILAGRSDVSIQGDRFVIQSGVLFDSGSASLGEGGREQLGQLAELLLEIGSEIPDDINWILRIDGHTDKRPIRTAEFPSNWELSAARAISVAKFLVEKGVAPQRLTTAGFAEFQPMQDGDSDAVLRRNRRIEFKLTER